MEILNNFGFDPVILVAQIVNFLIILYLLKRFLYKPVLSMLKKRKETVEEGLRQAEEARITLEKTIEEEKKILTKAQDEAKKIIEETKKQSLLLSQEAETNTKEKIEKMLLEARQKIEEEEKEIEAKLSKKLTNIAVGILQKSLERVFSEKEQKQIVEKALKQIRNTRYE